MYNTYPLKPKTNSYQSDHSCWSVNISNLSDDKLSNSGRKCLECSVTTTYN